MTTDEMTIEPPMTGGPDQLCGKEHDRFLRLDKGIVRLRDNGLPLGRLLRDVRDYKLWRGGWPEMEAARPSWGAYVQERAGLTPRRARQLIDYANLIDDLKSVPGFPLPPTEKQGRPLVDLSPDQRQEVADRVGGSFRGVSSRKIEQVAAEVKGEVVEREPLALVTVKGGAVTVGQSAIPRLVAEMESRALRIAALGPHAIPDAADALSDEEAALLIAQAERALRVLHRVHGQAARRLGNEDPNPQERFALVA